MRLKLACADFAFPLLRRQGAGPNRHASSTAWTLVCLKAAHLWPSKVFASPAKSGKQLGRKLADRGLPAPMCFQIVKFHPLRHQPSPKRRAAAGRGLVSQNPGLRGRSRGFYVTTLPGVYFDSENARLLERSCELAWRVEQAKRQQCLSLAHVVRWFQIKAALRRAQRARTDADGDYTHFTRAGCRIVPPSHSSPASLYARGAQGEAANLVPAKHDRSPGSFA
jgi:hypothetical protein